MPLSDQPSDDGVTSQANVASGQARSLLRSTLVIGASTFTNILVNVARTKAAALILGPAGIGLIALLQNVMNSVALLATAGLNVSGSQAVANGVATDNTAGPRLALMLAAAVLATVASVFLFACQHPIKASILGTDVSVIGFALIAFGAGLTVLGNIWFAMLNGYRRVGDIARTHVLSALLSAGIGISALVWLGDDGLFWFVVATPAVTALLLAVMLRRLPPASGNRPSGSLWPQIWALLSAGIPVMVSALLVSLVQLVARAFIKSETGVEGVGQFQAAWLISLTYVTFILNALLGDYFPRLSELIKLGKSPDSIITSQQEIGILLSGPILVFTMAIAPVAIMVLYSTEFDQSAAILRAQIPGDLFKVAAWPLMYALLAAGRSRLFFLVEAIGLIIFLAVLIALLHGLGLSYSGFAHAAMNLVQFLLAVILVRRHLGTKLSPAVIRQLAFLTLSMAAIYGLALWSVWPAGVVGVVLAAMLGVQTVLRLTNLAGIPGAAGPIVERLRRFRGLPAKRD